tara:strand:- start:2333 stop:2509 length:177 start_codon:yes stop_codon:yes gene_type:complete
MDNFADLYSVYLISSSSYTTATGMASLLSIKHDKIIRALVEVGGMRLPCGIEFMKKNM